MESRDTFMHFLSVVAASLSEMGIAGKLESVSIAVSGKAMVVDRNTEKVDSETEVFLVSGFDSKGGEHTIVKELRLKMGKNNIVCELVDSKALEVEGNQAQAESFLGDFFDKYNYAVTQLKEDGNKVDLLKRNFDKKVDNPEEFTADLIDAAIHATVLINNQK